MTKEELFTRLHEIMEIVGQDRKFEISENTNERKTLWIYQAPGEDELLAMFDVKLFPISAIKNIIYEYGQGTGDVGGYADTDLMLSFELKDNFDYTIEFEHGFENGTYASYYNGITWHTAKSRAEEAAWLREYNARMRAGESMRRLLWTAAEASKTKEVSAEELQEVKNKAAGYFDECPDDREILPYYAYLALCMLYDEKEDGLDVKWALRLIAKRKLEEELMQQIEQHTYCGGTEQAGHNNGCYLGLTATALRLLRECVEETTRESSNV